MDSTDNEKKVAELYATVEVSRLDKSIDNVFMLPQVLTVSLLLSLYVQKTPEIIPSDVTEFFLRRSGFTCEDPVVIKLVSLAAQKFLTDLAKESYSFSKKRQGLSGQATQKNRRSVLLLEDVAKAASKFGVSVNKPEYFADTPTAGMMEPPPGAPVGGGGEKRAASSSIAQAPGTRKKKKN